MGATITALLDLARTGLPGSAASELGEVLDLVTAHQAGRRVVVDLEGHREVRLAAPAALAARALLPIVENAVRHAESVVRISCVLGPSSVEVTIDDDGPGLDTVLDPVRGSEHAGDVFAPGASGRDGGTGLGLGIARRTARSLGGEVTAAGSSPEGGARFVVRLPRI